MNDKNNLDAFLKDFYNNLYWPSMVTALQLIIHKDLTKDAKLSLYMRTLLFKVKKKPRIYKPTLLQKLVFR